MVLIVCFILCIDSVVPSVPVILSVLNVGVPMCTCPYLCISALLFAYPFICALTCMNVSTHVYTCLHIYVLTRAFIYNLWLFGNSVCESLYSIPTSVLEIGGSSAGEPNMVLLLP